MQRSVAFLLVFVILVSALVAQLIGCSANRAAESAEPTSVEAPAADEQSAPVEPTVGEVAPQSATVEIPDVVGFGAQTARMNLAEHHLSFEFVNDPPDADLALDNSSMVIAQDPAAGEIRDTGSTVTLTLRAK